MAALTLTVAAYRDKILGAWQGKSAGVTLGAARRGQLTPGRLNYYSPVPGQPAASVALDFPLVWLEALEECGPETAPEDLAVAWLEHLDYSQDEYGYAALNLRRGLPPPASGAYSNWFHNATGGVMRADIWAMVAPGAPQVAAAYAYQDAKLDHSEEGLWAAMFLAAVGSAAFFLTDPLILLTIGLAMMPRTCRTARAVKTALAAAQRGASWLEARESVQHEVGSKNFTDAPQNIGFFTIGLLYGSNDFGTALCAGVNCGCDSEAVGGMLGAVLGLRFGSRGLPDAWTQPIGDIVIPGYGVRDFEAPTTLTETADRLAAVGRRIVAARCSDVEITEGETQAPDALDSPVPPSFASSEQAALPATLPDAPPSAPEIAVPTESVPFAAEAASPSEETHAAAFPEEDKTPTLSADLPVLPTITTAPPPESAAETVPADDMPTDAAPASSSRGVLAPQAVSAAEPAPIASSLPAAPSIGTAPAGTVTPDLVGAVAWADSALVKPLLITPPTAMVGQAGAFEVVMDTGDAPTVGYNLPKTLSFSIVNRGAEPFTGRIALLAPTGWQIGQPGEFGHRQFIAAHTGALRPDFTLRVPEGQGRIDIANAITLRFTPEDGGAVVEAEFLLLGASCWWAVGPFTNFDGEGFDRAYPPEDRAGLNESYTNRLMQPARWEKYVFPENVLELEPLFKGGAGVCYGQTILRSPTARDARLVANTNSGVKVWLNGALVLRRFNREPFRPILGGGPWAVDVSLRAGDNPVMVKWVRGTEPFQFSLTVGDRYGRGLPEVGNTAW